MNREYVTKEELGKQRNALRESILAEESQLALMGLVGTVNVENPFRGAPDQKTIEQMINADTTQEILQQRSPWLV